jgi:hypothetical protein
MDFCAAVAKVPAFYTKDTQLKSRPEEVSNLVLFFTSRMPLV